ncbi:efflux RND transporter permease subunit, partial [Acinetobacter baumannii]|uniref:efflux RND transporter permease subunit n=1 Tax=Acinetobacter baumannii TaxID=470 RepID=UPI003AF5B042
SGVEAKMFHPMAKTVVMALLGAMILSVTFVPAAVALFVTGEVTEKETRWMQLLKQKYRDVLDQAYQLKIVVVSCALSILVLTGVLA